MVVILPATFNIGPAADRSSILKYVRLLGGEASRHPEIIEKLIKGKFHLTKGIIKGETRLIAAGMKIEDIFNDRKQFKENIIAHVQVELAQFGK